MLDFSFLGFCFLLFSLNLKIHVTLTFSILTCGRCHVTLVAACWQKAFCVLCPPCVSRFGAPGLGVLGAVPRLGARVQWEAAPPQVPTPVTSLLSRPASSGLHGEAGCPRLRSIPREHQQPPLRGGRVRDPLRAPQPLLSAACAGLLLQQGSRVPGAAPPHAAAGPRVLYAGLPRGL